MKKGNTKLHWCRWCGDFNNHTTETHVYEAELQDKKSKKVLTRKQK